MSNGNLNKLYIKQADALVALNNYFDLLPSHLRSNKKAGIIQARYTRALNKFNKLLDEVVGKKNYQTKIDATNEIRKQTGNQSTIANNQQRRG